ncbi:hypothetical protein ANN_01801 [Periplaneta americana]|uniref:Reverse transcriptase n=1 Tax=Periplaneta americana TaxID=6978 RepID=A0ABQ8TXK1_PERAM|nr:hypothetical protein ANN_01801 [Periplaneta americana]
MMLKLIMKTKKKLIESLAEKKLPTEGCIGRNGGREKREGLALQAFDHPLKVQENRGGLELRGLHYLLVYVDDVNMLDENPQTVRKITGILLEASKQSLMLAGNEFQSLGRAIVKEDEYEEVRWDGIVSIVSWRERVFRLWCEERSFNDAVSTTRLFSIDGIGDSEMEFGEMKSRIRHILPDIRSTVGENLGKKPTSTESYPAFARIGLRENPGKNLNQVTCPDRDSNPGHLVSQPDALTVTPQLRIVLVSPVCDTKALGGHGGRAPCFLDLGTRLRCRHHSSYPLERPGIQFDRRLSEPRGLSGSFSVEKNPATTRV